MKHEKQLSTKGLNIEKNLTHLFKTWKSDTKRKHDYRKIFKIKIMNKVSNLKMHWDEKQCDILN